MDVAILKIKMVQFSIFFRELKTLIIIPYLATLETSETTEDVLDKRDELDEV